MSRRKSILKWSLITLGSLLLLLFLFGLWFINLIPRKEYTKDLKTTSVQDLPYLSQNIVPFRGKILAVVTSTDLMGSSNKSTGYELTELARAYYIFKANGFEVDVASPLGGKPPVVIDKDDMGAFDYAFLNDTIAQYKTSHTIPIDKVVDSTYQAIFFAGGKGAMFDFPENIKIQSIIRNYYQTDKVIGAVCHGPAALVNVMLDNNTPLLANKTVSSFTNKEELLLIKDARSIFPFLLQDKLVSRGARFNEGPIYLEKVSHDDNLITGQNPWSTWVLAETMIKQLGYTPKKRNPTTEENTIDVILTYQNKGYDQAKTMIQEMLSQNIQSLDGELIAIHSLVAGMQGKIGTSIDLIGLLKFVKNQSSNN